MIELARLVDADARELRKQFEDDRSRSRSGRRTRRSPRRSSRSSGDDTYPDATFTLRLAFGTVKGYEEDGKNVPSCTTIGGAFEHAEEHGNKAPFELPQRWFERKKASSTSKTPFNFVSTADIIGGNSGSPVVNRDGEVVGLIFDGNIQSLCGTSSSTSARAAPWPCIRPASSRR